MKVLMTVDLEGVSCIVNEMIQALPTSPLYFEARTFLMSDVNSAIEGAVEGGADEIVVFDSHCDGLNIILDKLNQKAKAILGNPILVPEEYMREFDAKILIGYHAMADTDNGLLCHTYPLEVKYIDVNEIRVGEIGMEILIASFLKIPTVLVTGDSSAKEETIKLIKDMNFVTVKEVLGNRSALCKNLNETSENIRNVAKKAILNYKSMELLKIEKPYKIEVAFYNEKFARNVFGIEKFYKKRLEDNKMIIEGDNLYKLWVNLKDSIWMNL